MKIEGKVRSLEVHTPAGIAGELFKNAHFTFNYRPNAQVADQISVTMNVRPESYTRGALFPVFEMNLPEGYVRHYITERLRKTAVVDDMLFLALSGNNGIGRLSYHSPRVEIGNAASVSLDTILQADNSAKLFDQLVDQFLLKTTAGIAGVQPKVVVPEQRGTLALPTLIVKSSDEAYPSLAINEYVCMSIAKAAGMATPDFWITDDKNLFVMRRFDIEESGKRLGMEDFSVLMGRPGDRKYEGRYETLLKAANLYEVDITTLYEQIVLSMMVGNGDAHLKNFAILYEDPNGPFTVSPLYDVVCTRVYGDETIALSWAGERNYPSASFLEKLGRQFGVRTPDEIISRISMAIDAVYQEQAAILEQLNASDILRMITRNRDRMLAGKS